MIGWEGSYEVQDARRCEAIDELLRLDPGCEGCGNSVVCPECGKPVYCTVHGEIDDVCCGYEDWRAR